MTSRLKHKLEIENINTQSAYLNESFVLIGTPLPALAETRKDKLEYVPEWQQEVRDEKGRRRFHGAFTGGFSAGYFNSVGSKEGWTPSTFKSSRSNRASNVQKPEDFMDEEDLAQMREERKLENTETFSSDKLGSTKAELEGRTLPSALQSLIEPARSSIGQKLLQTQGWKPGQGVGPRISLRKRKIQDAKLGRSAIEDEDMDGPEADEGKHMFAPRDSRLVVYDQKEDKAGLGYVGGTSNAIGRSAPLAMRAYHVQAKDEDDEDPYSVAGPSSRPFAFAGDADIEDGPIVIGESKPTADIGRRSDIDPNEGGRLSGPADTGRWHDGRPVLNGFELDPLGVPADKWFEFPDIPPDWRPRPARVWGTIRQWDEAPGEKREQKEVIKGELGKPLTFEQRGEALGEVLHAPEAKGSNQPASDDHVSKATSVFEWMSEKEKERLQAALTAAKAPIPAALKMEEDAEAEDGPRHTEVVIPPLSPRTAGAALRGFVPYGDDMPKQDRYISYLNSQTYNSKTPNPNLRQGSIEEINKELESFAASARIFKPMSFAMSSRFTSGSSSLAVSDMKQAKPGLHMYDAQKAKDAMEAAKLPVEKAQETKKLTPRERAAADGRFGSLTRAISNFYPTKLVCRRFGVQDPHPEGAPKTVDIGGSGSGMGLEGADLPKNDASWQDSFVHQSVPESFVSGESKSKARESATEGEETGERIPKSLAEVGMADDINQGRDTLTYTKPSIDIFKAIFASDDESSDDEEDGDQSKPVTATATNGGRNTDAAASGSTTRRGSATPAKLPEGPADLTTFKPIFVKREPEDISVNAERDPVKDGARKEKKRKKDKDKRKAVLSFHVDEDGEGESGMENGEKKRKMARDDAPSITPARVSSTNGNANDSQEVEAVWVEKPAVVPRLAGRKGAADFM